MHTMSRRQTHFVRDGDSLPVSAAEAFVAAVEKAIEARGVAAVALCGGPATRRLLELLAGGPHASRLEPLWTRLHIFWAIERHVRPDHPESCYRLAHWTLLSRFAVPSWNVHRIRAEMADAGAVASAYQHELRTFFQPRGLMREGLPCFDLAVLALEASEQDTTVDSPAAGAGSWVAVRHSTEQQRGEIVLTLPVVDNARNALVLLPVGAAATGRAADLLRFVA